MKIVKEDPSIDYEKVKQDFKNNYTNTMQSKRLVTHIRRDADVNEALIDKQFRIELEDEFDPVDLKRIKKRQFDFIGVPARTETHRPLTDRQIILLEKTAAIKSMIKSRSVK